MYSDHKPLQFFFTEKRPVSAMASSQIQRWALTLSVYSYQIKFRPGKEQGNADCLSRLPLAEAPNDGPVPGDLILIMGALADQESPVTFTNMHQSMDREAPSALPHQTHDPAWLARGFILWRKIATIYST